LFDDEIEEDGIVTDREPAQKLDAYYDKNDPAMAVDTMYSDQNAFKLALATHATKYEFQYNITTRNYLICDITILSRIK
jgi:hypothetical protein